MSVDHYENFPVASVLCPPAIRPAVVAIYHFARTADDLADEGDAPAATRLQALAEMRRDLQALYAPNADSRPGSRRWPAVFERLSQAIARHGLPMAPLADLLSAFEQDAHNPRYPTRQQLLHYCERSANPIGRLLLHLYGVTDALALRRADAICTALQLINFWQDLSVDLPHGRVYLPGEDLGRHGLRIDPGPVPPDSPATQALVAELCDWARGLMLDGAPLARTLPGRAGWELRLVVMGGLRVLEKLEALHHRSLHRRPRLHAWDVPVLLWRALRWHTSLAHAARRAGPNAAHSAAPSAEGAP